MSRQISYGEVAKHADQKSTWVVIHHDVYDVTQYLDEHPGGSDALLEYAGKDGTQAFEDVAHSEDAREVMKKYKIGTIPEDERGKYDSMKCGFVPHQKEVIVLPVESGNDCCEPSRPKPKKSWRTYDGSPARPRTRDIGSSSFGGNLPKGPCQHCSVNPPQNRQRPEPHVKAVVVPRESGGSGKLKWAVILLAAALVVGMAVARYNKG